MGYLLLFAIVGAVVWYFSSRTMFKLSVRDGQVLVVKGRVPIRFLQDVREVVSHHAVGNCTISGVAREHGAGLAFSGDIDEGSQQRLRNTFRLCPASEVRHAPPVKNPTLGQVLGIAWLAWLLEPRLRG
ncbi:MAG: DUF3634 family protein [Myxococcota bacterium]